MLGVERVPVDGNFFDDLGADSLVMAQFCARVRKREDLPTVSMKDIYRHPTIQSLAAAFADAAAPVPPAAPSHAPSQTSQPAPGVLDAGRCQRGAAVRPWRYMLCGTAQILIFLVFSSLAARLPSSGYRVDLRKARDWPASTCGRCCSDGRSSSASARCRSWPSGYSSAASSPAQFPVWSLAYVRFWCVKTLIRTSPVRLFTGSPLYAALPAGPWARRSEGASRSSPGTSRSAPTSCPSVTARSSARTVLHLLPGARRPDRDGPRHPRRGCDYVSEQAVLDIGTSMGDGTQLGHASSLHSGQAVPAGKRWHGSPGAADRRRFPAVEPSGCGPLREARL